MKKTTIFQKIRRIIYITIFLGFFIFYCLLVNPVIFPNTKKDHEVGVESKKLYSHVEYLTTLEAQRTHDNIESLNNVAEYIFKNFEESGCDTTTYQTFDVVGKEYKNIICKFEIENAKKIVIGAHYDVDAHFTHDKVEDPKLYHGADDNASGVAGILELARVLGNSKNNIKQSVEIVAYTLEELPYFRTENMGSAVHAKSLKDAGEKIDYMLVLEMIGFYSETVKQNYPLRFLSRFYPNKGNFIALIGQLYDSNISSLKKDMQSYSDVDVWSLSAPSFVTGIDFSDHRNYWAEGYTAYMLTDTAFYRNKNYHTINDTIDTLDFEKMKQVVNGVVGTLLK